MLPRGQDYMRPAVGTIYQLIERLFRGITNNRREAVPSFIAIDKALTFLFLHLIFRFGSMARTVVRFTTTDGGYHDDARNV
jgi:ABC-type enterochelin transport system permease subunit